MAITHNWIGSLRHGTFWFMPICEVTVEEIIVYCWRSKSFYLKSIGRNNELLLILLKSRFIPFILLRCCVLSGILTAGLGERALSFLITWYDQLSSQISGCFPKQSSNLQILHHQKMNLFSCFPAYKLWYMSEKLLSSTRILCCQGTFNIDVLKILI